MLLLTSRPSQPLFFHILILRGRCFLSNFVHFILKNVLLVSVTNISKGSTIVPTRRCSNFRKTTCKKRFQIISKSLRRNSPTLGHLTLGHLDIWTFGPLDPWALGPLSPWTLGPLDPCTLGPLDPWTFGPLDSWTLGPLDPCTLGPLDP